MYKLHYAKLELGFEEIPRINFKTKDERFNKIFDIVSSFSNRNDRVWILTTNFSGKSILLVLEEPYEIPQITNNYFHNNKDIFLQAYRSYEEAYQVSLDMKEESPLCYDKHYLNN